MPDPSDKTVHKEYEWAMLALRTYTRHQGVGHHRGATRAALSDSALSLAATPPDLQFLDMVGAWFQLSGEGSANLVTIS